MRCGKIAVRINLETYNGLAKVLFKVRTFKGMQNVRQRNAWVA